MVKAMAAFDQNGPLKPFEYDLPAPGRGDVDIKVKYCGVCHSDLSMLENEWGMSVYPFVGGHEVIGTVSAVGEGVSHLNIGETVGLGWYSKSCMTCNQCLSGNHNLCPNAEQTIVGRHGGFASVVRCSAAWAIPLHPSLDPSTSGPLFCGGVTVFNPLVQFDVKPTDRVGVIGVGGLGHLALQILNKWGCEVIAFSSNPAKQDDLKRLGAHRIVSSTDPAAIGSVKGSLDFILVTANVALDWNAYLAALGPKGRIHFVGAVLEPIAVPAFTMISGQKTLSGSPLGSPATTVKMLDFFARHEIEAITESFPLSKINDALERLRSGKARYRIVLTNDLS